MLSVKHQKKKSCAQIEGEMTIYNAAELKEEFMPLIEDARDLEINLAQVNEIDTAGVQLLMLAKKERATHGYALSLTDHSSAVLDVFELMDLVSYFNDPVVLPGKKGAQHGS